MECIKKKKKHGESSATDRKWFTGWKPENSEGALHYIIPFFYLIWVSVTYIASTNFMAMTYCILLSHMISNAIDQLWVIDGAAPLFTQFQPICSTLKLVVRNVMDERMCAILIDSSSKTYRSVLPMEWQHLLQSMQG